MKVSIACKTIPIPNKLIVIFGEISCVLMSWIDEIINAIIAIVKHLKRINKLGLVNTMIGESRMDSGVDGKQWDQMVELMKGYGWD